ncbi:MAG TPA: zf-HC2 domain-containing protein [Blastocatellia bacterium]|nr:zf-HC2 domain-containing protein [Blastocatellia bacterium]
MNVSHFESKSCRKVREYLDAYLDNELLVETSQEVAKHLEECPACSGALEARARVKSALKSAISRDAAPPVLQDKIRARLRRETPGTGSQWTRMLSAAAAIIAIVGAWGVYQWWIGRQAPAPSAPAQALAGPGAEVFQVGLGNHVHCALDRGFADRQFTPEEMTTKLGPEFAGLVALVKGKLPAAYRVTVGHRCRFEGREFVHLILKSDGSVASLALTRKNGEAFSRSTLATVMEVAGTPIYQTRAGELDVVGFETRDHLAFVVSNLPRADNLTIAASLAPSVRDFLARMES